MNGGIPLRTKEFLQSKKGFSAKWYILILFIIAILWVLLSLSLDRYFENKEQRDSETAQIMAIVTEPQTT